MAKANKLTLCESCEGEKIGRFCKHCGHGNNDYLPESNSYEIPDYIHLQMKDLHKKVETEPDKVKNKDLTRLREERDEFFRLCGDDVRLAVMSDASTMVRTLLRSKDMDINTVKSILDKGKKIGALVEAIESYIFKGGDLHGTVRIFKGTRPDAGKQSSGTSK